MSKYLGLIPNFKILIFQINSDDGVEENDEFQGFVQTIKNSIAKQSNIVLKKMESMNTSIKTMTESGFDRLNLRINNNEETLSNVTKN